MCKKLVYEDIKRMRDYKVPESRILDYKISLHSRSKMVEDESVGFNDSEKREISADISAFANTEGGTIIYGAKEENGVPVEIPGIKTSNIDSVISSLNNIINSDIEPHIIPQPDIYKIEILGENGRYLVVVHIKGQSITMPHRAKLGKWYEFYMRGANGKYPMEMEDLRDSFLFAEKISNRIERFQNERIGKIISEDITLPLYNADIVKGKGVLILHVIPHISFTSKTLYDIPNIKEKIEKLTSITYNKGSRKETYNIDGYLMVGPDRNSKRYNYVQFFRNGIVEFVFRGIGDPTKNLSRKWINPNEEKRTANSILIKNSPYYYILPSIEKSITDAIQSCINLYKELKVQVPFYVLTNLIGVKGIYLSSEENISYAISDSGFKNVPKFDRDNIRLPEVEIRNLENDVALVLKPLFDSLWNAIGQEKSPFYDESGNRK